jgi:hypothetical protein
MMMKFAKPLQPRRRDSMSNQPTSFEILSVRLNGCKKELKANIAGICINE